MNHLPSEIATKLIRLPRSKFFWLYYHRHDSKFLIACVHNNGDADWVVVFHKEGALFSESGCLIHDERPSRPCPRIKMKHVEQARQFIEAFGKFL